MNWLRWIAVLCTATVILGCEDDAAGCSENDDDSATVSIGISDAPVDDVKEVVLEIDRITLVRAGDDVVIETFTIEDGDIDVADAETFQLDLMDYQGNQQLLVIQDLEIPDGSYSSLRLEVLDENDGQSYVKELDDTIKELKVPSNGLILDGFSVEVDSVQTFTIEFDLRQAMTYNPSPERYILKPRGVRIQANAAATTLLGGIDSSLFDTESPCDSKSDPLLGNVLYLYEGHDLAVEDLADVYDPDEASDVPSDAIAPFAATAPREDEDSVDSWAYTFGFLPAGDYTLVFSCDAEDDDPESVDDTVLPLPEDQIIELSLGAGTSILCNLPIVDSACSN